MKAFLVTCIELEILFLFCAWIINYIEKNFKGQKSNDRPVERVVL